jgi:quercetin dioxygenase-like cupin family protein
MKRIITKNDSEGKSYIVSTEITNIDIPVPNIDDRFKFYNLWLTDSMPVDIKNSNDDPTLNQYISTTPVDNGSFFRIVNYPPERKLIETLAAFTKEEIATFETTTGVKLKVGDRHPLIHMTESIDFGVVLKGEIYLVLEKEEILLRPFDTIIQRGTNHAWSNRSEEDCLVAYVLLDANTGYNVK